MYVASATARFDKERAEPNFKELGLLLACRDDTGEPLAWLHPGSAGSNTVADHLQVLGAAIAAHPPQFRWELTITYDGACANHALIEELDRLATRRGYDVIQRSAGNWARERAARC